MKKFDIYNKTWRLSHVISPEQTYKVVIMMQSLGFIVAHWWDEHELIYGSYHEYKYLGGEPWALIMRCRGETPRNILTYDELLSILDSIIKKRQSMIV
jgi:hypothetical protein